jgi:hypothetical protein
MRRNQDNSSSIDHEFLIVGKESLFCQGKDLSRGQGNSGCEKRFLGPSAREGWLG